VIQSKRVLAIIPARGGSKGVPGKNIYVVGGKPLLAWTINEAQKSRYIDRLILSSDDDKIIQVALEHGCEVPFVRPPELATDDANPVDAVVHAINSLDEEYDYVVLLQVTSPMRSVEDIDECIELCVNGNASSSVSVTKTDKSPYWMYELDKNQNMLPLLQTEARPQRRQDGPELYELNGALYVADVKYLLANRAFMSDETLAYIMPGERSLDIDTELDIKFLEFLLETS